MFADLLVKVGREEIFYQLIKFCNPSSWEKLSALLYYFSKQSNSSEFEDVVNKQIFALELQWSNDEKMLRNAYKDKVAQYNLALSKNMFTPNDILEELSHLKGMNNCKMIRVNSLQTLRIKKNMKKADW